MAATTTQKDQIEARHLALLEKWIKEKNVRFVPGTLTSKSNIHNSFEAFYNHGEIAPERSTISYERFWLLLRKRLGPLPAIRYHGKSLWSTCVELRVDDSVPFQDETSVAVLPDFNVDEYKIERWHDIADVLIGALVQAGIAIDTNHRFLRYSGSRWLTTTDQSLRHVLQQCCGKIGNVELTDERYGEVVNSVCDVNSYRDITPARVYYLRNALLVNNYIDGDQWVKAYPFQQVEPWGLFDLAIDWSDVSGNAYLPAVKLGAAHLVLDKLYDTPVRNARMNKLAVAVRSAANAEYVRRESEKLRVTANLAMADVELAPEVPRNRVRL